MNFASALFLPLLGGYLFFALFNATRYRASAYPAQSLVFPAATCGLVFLAIAHALHNVQEQAASDQGEWFALVAEGLLPGAAVASIFGALWFWRNYERPETHGYMGPLEAKAFRRSVLASTARVIGLGLYGCVALAVCVWATGRPLGKLVVMSAYWTGAHAVLIVSLSKYLSEKTNWPFQGLIVRTSGVIVALATSFAAFVYYPNFVMSHWTDYIRTVEDPDFRHIGTPALSLGVAVAALIAANSLVPRKAGAAYQASSDAAHAMGKLFYKALYENLLLEITLDTKKVYIGWVVGQPPCVQSADGHLQLLPAVSGYRDKDTLELKITTDYRAVIAQQTEQAVENRTDVPDFHEFTKVIPIAAIKHAGQFDPALYSVFNATPLSA